MKNMDIGKAVEAIRRGERVRLPDWGEDVCISGELRGASVTIAALLATDWEIVPRHVSFVEAMRAVAKGGGSVRARIPRWRAGEWLRLNSPIGSLADEDIDATDWIVELTPVP